MGTRAQAETMEIWRAQEKLCAICGVKMFPVTMNHPVHGWTIEHVFNRASKRYFADGNKLVTHAKCNNAKDDREPTGCEIILLHAVNAKLGYELTPRAHSYQDRVQGPSALAVALLEAMVA